MAPSVGDPYSGLLEPNTGIVRFVAPSGQQDGNDDDGDQRSVVRESDIDKSAPLCTMFAGGRGYKQLSVYPEGYAGFVVTCRQCPTLTVKRRP